LGQAQPPTDRADALGADQIVLEEPHPALYHAARLGLGDVVEERGELQDRSPCDTAAERLVHVRAELLAERLERGETREHAVGAGARARLAATVPGVSLRASAASRRTPRSARSGSSASTRGPGARRRRARRSARPPVGSTMGARPRVTSSRTETARALTV